MCYIVILTLPFWAERQLRLRKIFGNVYKEQFATRAGESVHAACPFRHSSRIAAYSPRPLNHYIAWLAPSLFCNCPKFCPTKQHCSGPAYNLTFLQ